MDKEKSIAEWVFFKGLDQAKIASLAAVAVVKKYREGEIVFAEGQPGLGFHTVAQGLVKVFKTSPEGKEQILHLIGPGEPFGEVAVFLGSGYPAWAQAMEDTTTLFLPRAALKARIAEDPDLALGMMGVLSFRLVGFTRMVENLTLKEAPARLASYFLEAAGDPARKNRIELGLSKGQLASLLGTTPETLSRILNKMKSKGLLSEQRPYIIIEDRSKLEDLAQGFTRLND